MTHFFFSSMEKYETAASACDEAPRGTWSHLPHHTIRAGSHRQLGKDSWWETGVYLNLPLYLSFECMVSNAIDSCLNVFWCRQMWTTKDTDKICWSLRMKWRSTIFSTVKSRHWLRTSLENGYFLTAFFKCSSELNKLTIWTVMRMTSVTHLLTCITGRSRWPAGKVQQTTGETSYSIFIFNFQPRYALKL